MASPYGQDDRIASFKSPLGDDELPVLAFTGGEGLSELFEFRLDVANTNKEILKFDDAIGKHGTLTVRSWNGLVREFDGILTEARLVSVDDTGNIYRIVLRPWLWLLSRQTNSLIFHEMTARQIIAEIFGKHGGLSDFVDKCQQNHPVLEYCAQYRESDMDFVCRLMEQHGISYHFEHQKGAHKLVMGDDVSAYGKVEGQSRPFVPVVTTHWREKEHLVTWQPERKFTTGKVTLRDYDFKKPPANMEVDSQGDAAYANAQLEDYDYPGLYVEPSDGQDYAKVRLDMHRAEDQHYFAEGDSVTLVPGYLVDLTDHPDDAQNAQYLILRCRHAFTGLSYRSGGKGGGPPYVGEYEFMRSDKPFAPAMVTEKPVVQGPQTAVVVGSGDIDCDEWGRILVKFHWDRKNDQSRRVRVAQVWASQRWGAIFTPRVDMEVIVEFLEGDPDQPIVTGCVYNETNRPPYDLPDEKYVSGWKSNSDGGYNEIVMDDTSGNELVRVHAQYDLDTTVEHDEKREVRNDRKVDIRSNDELQVGKTLLIEAKESITLKVGQSTITMDGMSIKIESPNVDINAKMAFSSSAGTMSQHKASATFIINGALVTIN
jgi:type VI secretion system secreted protein VgrG